MSYLKLTSETLEKWTSTRKGPQLIGSKFIHPGIFATSNFQSDRLWFFLAAFIELLTLFVALFLTGFNPFVIVGAVLAIIGDVVLAIILHKGEKNINKFQCKQEIISYEKKINLIDNTNYRSTTETLNRSIKSWEKKKLPFIIGLFVIAASKVVFTFFALLPYGILAYLVPALFFLCAYIHIKHTGFWNAHRVFSNAYAKEEAIFHYDDASNKKSASKYFISATTPFLLQNLPENLKEELDEILKPIVALDCDSKNLLRIDKQNQINSNSSDLIITGKNTNHKLIYNEISKKFSLSFWGNVKDNELFEMINESGFSADLKSFLCYTGIKAQAVSQPDIA